MTIKEGYEKAKNYVINRFHTFKKLVEIVEEKEPDKISLFNFTTQFDRCIKIDSFYKPNGCPKDYDYLKDYSCVWIPCSFLANCYTCWNREVVVD